MVAMPTLAEDTGLDVLARQVRRIHVKGDGLRAFLQGDFPDRLRIAREQNDLSASDLAYIVWGEKVNAKGHRSAANRDRVGVYENRQAKPSEENLRRLAEVFELDINDLDPDNRNPGRGVPLGGNRIAMHNAPGGKVVLDVRATVSVGIAAEILKLVEGDPDNTEQS
ncbi:MAG: helix-turn-helix transcriptional regulator [Pseudomonadota bacterium]